MSIKKEAATEADISNKNKIFENYGGEVDSTNASFITSSMDPQGATEDEKTDGEKKQDKTGMVHRKLESRHVQLIAIGGSIGTGLFVTIGSTGLVNAGPLGLLLAYTFWTCIILMLTTSIGEMVSFLPIASPFVTMAGRCVDEAFECCVGWNFFIMQALYIPFEITAVNGMIHFWRDDYSPVITLVIQIFIYACINVFAVRLYGESEFWLSLSKLILCIGLLFFTIITMCGGNPQHDAFGFRNWNVAGGPLNEINATGALGRFQGFLKGLISACFTVVGPEYMSMVSAEAKNPRKTMPTAFKTVIYRLALFYIGGALSVTILIAYNDPTYVKLTGDTSSAASNAASSPYVVAMQNLKIDVLPHIVNAVVLSSAFSAGNSYTYCSSRALYSLSKRGFAPKIFSWCTKNGVPLFSVAVAICFSMLSLMQLGSSSKDALEYMVNLCTGSQLLNYGFMSIIYFKFYRAVKAQGLDRSTFPYRAWYQPYSICFAGFFIWCMIGTLGYECLMPGKWSIDTFLYNYVMIFVSAGIYIFWKILKRTKFVKPEDADIFTGIEEIEEHEYEYYAKLEGEGEKGKESKFKNILHWVF